MVAPNGTRRTWSRPCTQRRGTEVSHGTMTATLRREVVPSSVLGMLLLIGAEVMFFAGLISAFTIAQAGAEAGRWTTPTAPLLPVASTLSNTAALLMSGVC